MWFLLKAIQTGHPQKKTRRGPSFPQNRVGQKATHHQPKTGHPENKTCVCVCGWLQFPFTTIQTGYPQEKHEGALHFPRNWVGQNHQAKKLKAFGSGFSITFLFSHLFSSHVSLLSSLDSRVDDGERRDTEETNGEKEMTHDSPAWRRKRCVMSLVSFLFLSSVR